MYINVAQLLKENVGSSRKIHIDEADINEDINHIEGSLTLIRTECSILVEGRLTVTISGICSRCLSCFNYNVDIDFSEEYFQNEDKSSGSFLSRSSDSFTIDKNHDIDLSDAIIQYTSLATPMKLLCRTDCAGICSCCGQNLNESYCSCANAASIKHRIKSFN